MRLIISSQADSSLQADSEFKPVKAGRLLCDAALMAGITPFASRALVDDPLHHRTFDST
jgi:hypothetical protein